MGVLLDLGLGQSRRVHGSRRLFRHQVVPSTVRQGNYTCRPRTAQGKLCMLYVLAQAKSLQTSKWVFLGISASPAPFCTDLCCAWPPMLSHVCVASSKQKLPTTSNVRMSNRSQAGSILWLQKPAQSLADLDCDNINSHDVTQAFTTSYHWLHKKRRLSWAHIH